MAMTTSSDMEGSWRIALSLCLIFCFSMASLQEKGVSGVEKDVLASGRNACYKVIWIPCTTLFFFDLCDLQFFLPLRRLPPSPIINFMVSFIDQFLLSKFPVALTFAWASLGFIRVWSLKLQERERVHLLLGLGGRLFLWVSCFFLEFSALGGFTISCSKDRDDSLWTSP